jgi:hypothetical protein
VLTVWAMKLISYSRHRFPPEVIRRAVWLYLRFTLSYRDVEDLLAERGLTVIDESIRRWVHISPEDNWSPPPWPISLGSDFHSTAWSQTEAA